MGTPDIVPARPIPNNIVEILRQEQRAEGQVAAYPQYLWQKFLHSRVRRGLFQVSLLVEPVDRTLGKREGQPHAKAFYYGSLLGMRVTAECVENIDATFDGISLGIGLCGGKDNQHARHVLAAEIMDVGAANYAAVGDTFDPLFDEWSDHLAPDVTHQAYLYCGFGLPLSYLSARQEFNATAQRRAALASMEAALENPDAINWDELLR